MTDKRKPAYHIRQTQGHHPSFTLEKDGEGVGALSFENGHGSRAKVIVNGKSLVFSRSKGFKKDMRIHQEGGGSPVAQFMADILSRGVLTIGDTTYSWKPVNRTWTAWAWYDDKGEEILRIERKFHFSKTKGEVHAKNPLYHDIEMLLALLGWHLLLLGYQNSLEHIFSSIDAYRAKRKARKAA